MNATVKKFSRFVIALAIPMALASCSNDDNTTSTGNEVQPEENQEETPKARVDITLTDDEKLLSQQSADFSIRLLQVADKVFEDNSQIVLSPLSASYALSMINNGASGDTQQEILDALGFNGFDADEVNAFNKKLIASLAELDNTCSVNTANSLWLNKEFTAKGSFKEALQLNYDAEVTTADFSKAETIKQINAWCEKETNGCIQNFIKELSPDCRLVLLNALYFKGRWESQFKATKSGTFTTANGELQDADFMYRNKAIYPYASNEHFALAELPYGNEAFGLVIALPHEGKDITDCINGLTGEKWLEAVNDMKGTSLNMKLPKFKAEHKGSLVNALKEMGINKAFSPGADFTALSEEGTFISEVLQANYFCIDENGTEAAAVTGITLDTSAGPEQVEVKPVDFLVNRPFLYFIKEKSTNVILFMGKIEQISNK